ncbi:uncharacterized protein LOC118424056 isoform X1 [Branchiostoma floridae]|uniref:Uncharacterized protein LOC118424056 isoform X1 n=2 Tax=Branchiostoma floridae TaxID=7739 RepID=A0A9J7LST1_BRAFL|nr:uncharacterized protein LOC118424056 isoform X1 [Branchiostoma floridae]
MSTDWLTMPVALMAILATSGALDLQVPVVDMGSFGIRSLVQRENENWILDVTVSWEQPNGVDPEGYMVLLQDQYADITDAQTDEDFIDDWDFDFDFDSIGSSSVGAGVTTARQRLEDRGFVFVESESYSVGDLKFTRDYVIEVVVLNNTDSAGRGVVHIFTTPDCYSRTQDLDFCRQQDVVFASQPANMSLLNVSVTCVEVVDVQDDDKYDENGGGKVNKTVAMATAWISWVRPVQQGGDIVLYLIRLTEHDGKNVHYGVFDKTVAEDSNRNPLVPILYVIDQVKLNQTYTLKVTPWVNKTGDFSPYGMAGQLTFHTNNLSAERCFPQTGTQVTASAVSGTPATTPVTTPGAIFTFCCLFIILSLPLVDLKVACLL